MSKTDFSDTKFLQRAIILRSHLESTPEGMIHASAETAVIVAPAAMETVETVKVCYARKISVFNDF